jgi:hypothetical protein
MELSLEELSGKRYEAAFARRADIAELALAERNAALAGNDAAGGKAFESVAEYAAAIATRTCALTLLAGAGSRWLSSLEAARALAPGERPAWFDPSFDPERPRGLYPVRDFLRALRGDGRDGGKIPVAAYALAATDGLGRHLIVVRGWESEIDREILAPLGISLDARLYHTQDAPFGKPLGHGDAAYQCRDILRNYDYVIANFGGDANSRRTILASLLALDAINARAAAEGRDLVDLMMPAAPIAGPAYPIVLDEGGLPRAFGHQKLQGHAMSPAGGSPLGQVSGYTNVGVRVYRASALVERLESFKRRYWKDGEGYAIPGNDPSGHEFALDNVDAELAAEGRARILAVGRSEELTPAKTLGDIPAFERAASIVAAEDLT